MNRKVQAAGLLAALLVSSVTRANQVVEWNRIMQDTIAGNVLVETRIGAITQLAVFEAVNAITHEYKPYVGGIAAPSGASADAATIAAAHTALKYYFPAKAAALDQARAQSLASIPNGPSKDNGVAVGETAASVIINLRANDGATPAQSYLPTTTEPGDWQLTPSCPATGGGFAHWGTVQPFGFDKIEPFQLAPPPSLTSKRYADAYNEVKRVGSRYSTERPQDRADVARFYAVVLTIRTWNPVVTQLSVAQGRSQTHTARALALVNMAMSDALVAVYRVKYAYTFWRPETAIRNGDVDGNKFTQADPTFEPFVTTPCHPSYASAHGSTAHAARYVVEHLYGRKGHNIVVASPAVPDVTLYYSSIEKITDDISDARIYGGIHFRFDQEAGARLGHRIGQQVYWRNMRRDYQQEFQE